MKRSVVKKEKKKTLRADLNASSYHLPKYFIILCSEISDSVCKWNGLWEQFVRTAFKTHIYEDHISNVLFVI